MIVAGLSFQQIIAVLTINPVVARSAAHGLGSQFPRSGIDFIEKTVVSGSGIDDVVSGSTVDIVSASTRIDGVVSSIAEYLVVSVERFYSVCAITPRHNIVPCSAG